MRVQLPTILSDHFWRWIERRAPRANKHTLTHKNLYILPTARGYLFLLLILVLWLIGTNYQNNLVLAMSFFLMSIFVVSIFHTYANMAALIISFKTYEDAHAGDDMNIVFQIESTRRRWIHAISCTWKCKKKSDVLFPKEHVYVNAEQEYARFSVPLRVHKRGRIFPPRMLIESIFPLGIVRCWTWLSWDISLVVYPQAKKFSESPIFSSDEDGDGAHPVRGGEDYNSLKNYERGDPLKHVAWKVYAKEKGLYTKEFSQSVSTEHWLDFSYLEGLSEEDRLSDMCYWALFLHQKDQVYGLKLPGIKIDPDSGERHLKHVLHTLSLYGNL